MVTAKRSVALEPKDAILHFNLGTIYALQENAPLAKNEIEQGLALAQIPAKRFGRAMVLFQLKSHADSEPLKSLLAIFDASLPSP